MVGAVLLAKASHDCDAVAQMVSGAASTFRSSWSEPRVGSACRLEVASLFEEEEVASSFEQLGSVGALLLVREASTAIDVAEV